MKRISRNKATIAEIDHRIEPAITVKQDEKFVLETEDAAAGYLRDEATLPYPADRPTHRAWPPLLNPVAGPVAVKGVKAGSVLAVTIHDIVPDTQGYTIQQPGDGLFGDSLKWRDTTEYLTRILRHEAGPSGTLSDGICRLNDRLSWNLAPFIGTMCTAPHREVPSSVNAQGPFGGNLDVRDVCKGSTVYYNVYHDGGLLFAGDAHGSQGDGELSGTANEIRAELTLSCRAIDRPHIPHVRIERDNRIIALYTDKPLEGAVRGAVDNLMHWLVDDYGWDTKEAFMFIGTCPDVRLNVYQMVDLPGFLFTAGIEMPKKYLG